MIEYELKNEVCEVEKLEGFINDCTEKFNLPLQWTMQINMVLEEAVSNVILYAFDDGKEHKFKVLGEKVNDTFSITIIDDGIAFDPVAQAPDVDITLSAEERKIGGLGIFLMKQVMNEVCYERKNGCNILMMSKNIND